MPKNQTPSIPTIDEIVAALKKSRPETTAEQIDFVRRAHRYAADAHENHAVDSEGRPTGQPQMRGSGEPYLVHLLWTAKILADLKLPAEVVAAGLLHDVVEDTSRTVRDIEKNFGHEMAKMCDGLAKLGKLRLRGEERQIESLRKMFLAMAEDMRIVYVKIADRLHNMRTLGFVRPEKRARIAKETLMIHAPLAHRLGIFSVKTELEDLAFRWLHPVEFFALEKDLRKTEKRDENRLERVESELAKMLGTEGIKIVATQHRRKHLYSIFKKLQKGKSLSQIYDRLAVRVIVRDIQSCYRALGVIHAHWRPIPGRVKDYIAHEKPNGYQSLHTTVVPAFLRGKKLAALEIQIRTAAMHRAAEFGPAAHAVYKEKGSIRAARVRQTAWLAQLADFQKTLTGEEFYEGTKQDILTDQIWVFTKGGEIKTLPAGATPVDLAYLIHTDIGDRCAGARVNGEAAALDRPLRSGDQIEILPGREPAPRHHWLSFVKTSSARQKIKHFFRSDTREKNLAAGQDLLRRECARLGKTIDFGHPDGACHRALEHFPYKTCDDLFIAVGQGAVSPQSVVGRLFSAGAILSKKRAPGAAPAGKIFVPSSPEIAVQTRACCRPRPGDEMIGFITRTGVVVAHKKSCPTARKLDESRIITVAFVGAEPIFTTKISLFGRDRVGLLRDLAEVFSDEKLSLFRTEAHRGVPVADQKKFPSADFVAVFECEIPSVTALSRLIARLERVPGVVGTVKETAADSG